jgi:hypothetical protein
LKNLIDSCACRSPTARAPYLGVEDVLDLLCRLDSEIAAALARRTSILMVKEVYVDAISVVGGIDRGNGAQDIPNFGPAVLMGYRGPIINKEDAYWAIASVELQSQPQRPRQILGILGYHVDEIQEVGTILPPCSTVDRELLARCKDVMAAISALY